ncbi:MAG: calcium/sodium antiporter [Rhodothermia bacterium]|nr:MAG: calcium/sodium antiporter [Rhodothermia bacterium]
MVLQFIVFVTGLVILYFGAEWLVKAASSIAYQFGIRPMVIGLTVVALGTSMPEFVLNFFAVLVGEDALAIGNIIGSNIANIGLILGVSAVLMPLVVSSETLRKEYPLMLATSLLFYALAWDGLISRVDGGILVFGLMALMVFLVVDGRRHIRKNGRGTVSQSSTESTPETGASSPGNGDLTGRRKTLYLLGGAIGLTFGARLMVTSAVEIAHELNINPVVVGLTIVAIGTSLPELAACVVCAMKNETDMSIGNVLGSNMLNILFVVGTISMIRPVTVEPVSIAQHLPVMIAFAFVLYPIARFRNSISKAEGVLLLVAFGVYLGWLIYPYV